MLLDFLVVIADFKSYDLYSSLLVLDEINALF